MDYTFLLVMWVILSVFCGISYIEEVENKWSKFSILGKMGLIIGAILCMVGILAVILSKALAYACSKIVYYSKKVEYRSK